MTGRRPRGSGSGENFENFEIFKLAQTVPPLSLACPSGPWALENDSERSRTRPLDPLQAGDVGGAVRVLWGCANTALWAPSAQWSPDRQILKMPGFFKLKQSTFAMFLRVRAVPGGFERAPNALPRPRTSRACLPGRPLPALRNMGVEV